LVAEGWLRHYWKLVRHNFSAELQALVDTFPKGGASDA
jgi:hypothetical protein